MEYKYNYSIIIPHKNIPNLLRRCVSSIPRRDDTQIIIVDDNSDPNKVDFEHFPFLGEPNVTVIFDKTSKGAGHARNIGLEAAECKWYIFADADDFFFYSINQAMDDCLKSDADIIYYNSTNLDSDTYKSDDTRSGLTNMSVTKFLKNDNYGEDYLRYRHPAPWGKLIRSSLVKENNIRFAEVRKANDVWFSVQCGYYAKKIKAYDKSIYCLTTRCGNVTSNFSQKALYDVICTESDVLRFMVDKKINSSPIFKQWEDDVFSLLLKIKEENELYIEACRYLENNGFSNSYIKDKLKYIINGNRKAKIVSLISKLLHL